MLEVEEVQVKKKGITKTLLLKKIDQKEAENKIKNLLQKDKKINIFAKLEMMINSKDTAGSTNFDNNNVKYKMNINYKEALNHKLSMIINLKLIHGIHYLKTVLKKKEISRELFILSIEDGSEVYIPKDLS